MLTPIPPPDKMHKSKQNSDGNSTTHSSEVRPDTIQPTTQDLATSNGSSATPSSEVRPDIDQPTSNSSSAITSEIEPRIAQSAKRDLATSYRDNTTDGDIESVILQSAKRPKFKTSISCSDQASLQNLHSSLATQSTADDKMPNPNDTRNRYPLRSPRRSPGGKALADAELPLTGRAQHAMIGKETYLLCQLWVGNLPRPYSIAVPIGMFGSDHDVMYLQSLAEAELLLAGGAQRVAFGNKPYFLCQLRVVKFPCPYSFAVPFELFGSGPECPTARFSWTTEEDDLIKEMRGVQKQSWESIQAELPNYRTTGTIQVRYSKIKIYKD